MGGPQQVERPGTIVAKFTSADRPVRRLAERHEFRLGGMDCQTEPSKSFWHDVHDAMCVVFVAESDYEVISMSDEEGMTTHAWLHILSEPQVQHIMQEHVRKERRKHTTNERANFFYLSCG